MDKMARLFWIVCLYMLQLTVRGEVFTTLNNTVSKFPYLGLDIILENNDITNLELHVAQQQVNKLDFGGVDILRESSFLSEDLQSLANDELGVTLMQNIVDGLDYEDVEPKYAAKLDQFVENLANKLERYLKVLRTNKIIVENIYPKNPTSDTIDCCQLPKSQLTYNSLYGTYISRASSCDLINSLSSPVQRNPGRNLTEVFQHITQPSIKWQYFISTEGLHNEFPAHNVISGYFADCKQWMHRRHRAEYVCTVYPQSKNVVIMIDTGTSALYSSSQLEAAKAVASHILFSLSENDKVTVLRIGADVQLPSNEECLSTRLCGLSYEAKLLFNAFVEDIVLDSVATNHVLGFQKAFKLIWNTLNPTNNSLSEEAAMIIYISPGLLSNMSEASAVMRTIAYENARLRHRVVINTYAVLDTRRPVLYEETFLRDIAEQNFYKYSIEAQYPLPILPGRMVSVTSSSIDLTAVVGNFTDAFQWVPSSRPRLHLPIKDFAGTGVVVPVMWPCFYGNHLIGVTGLDIHLADIVEDVTYFAAAEQGTYMFLINTKGFTIMHPSMTRPIVSTVQPIHTHINHLEQEGYFKNLLPNILITSNGTDTFLSTSLSDAGDFSSHEVTYDWKHVRVENAQVQETFYIMVLKRTEPKRVIQEVSHVSNTDASLVYHRIDLLQTTGMCMHLKQLATVDTGVLFLAANSFLRPFDYLTDIETKQMVKNYIAFLRHNDLIAAPAEAEQTISEAARKDALTVSLINSYWKLLFKTSDIRDYIVRRYVATPSGAVFIHPGVLMSKTYDATKRPWFKRALEFPGKVILTAPHLDNGGAGYIVTLSHTVSEGRSSTNRSRIAAVMGMDLTLGFLYKLMSKRLKVCEHAHIRCFLLDDRGYLIAHPSLLEPNGIGPKEEKHVTHKEALIAADILSHIGFIEKKLCNSYNDRTIQRFYHFNTSIPGVITNLLHGEHCSKYQISAIPGTNIFVGMVNQTCDNVKAFCPCSVMDRLCLNCNRMEQSECECPCECPLRMDICATDGDVVSDRNGSPSCSGLETDKDMTPLPAVDTTLLNRLSLCLLSPCGSKYTQSDCLGVLDCQWCSRDSDGVTPLSQPFCSTQRVCWGGVMSAATPYGDQKPVPENKLQKVYTEESTPIGPVTGGIMACLLVFALALYCYCHRVHRGNQHQYLGSTDTQYHMGIQENGDDMDGDDIGYFVPGDRTNIVLATFNSPSVSPYRVNQMYQPPRVPRQRTESDLGYSTMTPNEDSEIASTAHMEPLGLRGRERYRPDPSAANSRQNEAAPMLPPPPSANRRSPSSVTPGGSPQPSEITVATEIVDVGDREDAAGSNDSERTLLPSIGQKQQQHLENPGTVSGQTELAQSNRILAPVQVHMADVLS